MAEVIWFGPSEESLQAVRAPHELKVTYADVDASSTTRTSRGMMVRSRVRGGETAVRTLELAWDVISEAEAAVILRAVEETYFYMKYRDVRNQDYRIAQFYAGDREVEVKRVLRDGRYVIGSLSFNCIEV